MWQDSASSDGGAAGSQGFSTRVFHTAPGRVRVWLHSGWVLRGAVITGALVLIGPVVLLVLALVLAFLVGLAVFVVLSFLAWLLRFPAWVLRQLVAPMGEDGRRNVRVIRRDAQ
jgi:hypothetical protein